MPLSKVLNPPRRTALARLSGVALAALGGAALSACDQLGQATGQQPSFRGIDITGAPYGRDFRLTDVDGQERTLADYRGKLVLLYFGFVQCPDVCPTALTRAVETKRLLGPDGDQLQVIFVTVDPERDTPEILREYMAAFDPSFVALRGDAQRLKETAAEFKVFYRQVPTGSSYTNTASIAASSNDPNAGNNSGSVVVNVLPDGADLRITKSKVPNPVAQGSPLTSTLTTINNGPRTATGPTSE